MREFYVSQCKSRIGWHAIPIYLAHGLTMGRVCTRIVDTQRAHLRPEMQECVWRMLSVLRGHSERPVGVSAPQVGYDGRIIAFKDASGTRLMRCVANPELTPDPDGSLRRDREGCLSHPGYFLVERHSRIVLRGFDLLLNRYMEEQFEGLSSAIVQHEIDHLDAIPWPPPSSQEAAAGSQVQ